MLISTFIFHRSIEHGGLGCVYNPQFTLYKQLLAGLDLGSLIKMKRLLQSCGSVAATLQQLDLYATTGGNKVAN